MEMSNNHNGFEFLTKNVVHTCLLSYCVVSLGNLFLSLVQRKHTCLKLRGEMFYLNK